MKILHLATSFLSQSAGYRLHKGLINSGIDSKVFVGFKGVIDPTVIGAESFWENKVSGLKSKIDQIPLCFYRHKTGLPFSPSIVPDQIISKISNINPSIIHLHWVCGGFIRIEALKKIKVPLVWTLHDSWAFTGGCHIPYDCKKYQDKCGKCPTLGSNCDNDLSRSVFLRKKKSWQDLDITIVTPSNWLHDCAMRSNLFKHSRIEVIPNGINTGQFRPIEKNLAKTRLSIPKDKKIILFGAINSTSDPNKGYNYLKQALQYLNEQKKIEDAELVVFGGKKSKDDRIFDFKVHSLGTIHDDTTLAFLYSAADVFVAPSLSENLPNTILESLACGTPCVAFNIGGISDLIDHKSNGYLASPFDPMNLGAGIEWVINNEERWNILSKNARKKIINKFDITKIAQNYIDVYNSIYS